MCSGNNRKISRRIPNVILLFVLRSSETISRIRSTRRPFESSSLIFYFLLCYKSDCCPLVVSAGYLSFYNVKKASQTQDDTKKRERILYLSFLSIILVLAGAGLPYNYMSCLSSFLFLLYSLSAFIM